LILILSTDSDPHAQAVLQHLAGLGAAAHLLNLAEFPQKLALSLSYREGRRDFALHSPAGRLPLAEVKAVWWRRPQPFQLHPEITKESYRHFAYNEGHEAFAGLWQSLEVFWINHPTRDEVAARKVYQLQIALEVGLNIPRTLVSNDRQEVQSFINAVGEGQVIYKSFSATEHEWRETRLLKQAELALLDGVRYAPVIFQEYIPAQVDLRITVVGGEMFPAAIYSQQTSYAVDFRMDWANARAEPHVMPDAVAAKLRALMERLGLVYGAIDMRLTPQGEYVFLEINPAGQWLFIEQRTGQPITAALAARLAASEH